MLTVTEPEPEPFDLPHRLRAQADVFLTGRNRVLQVSGGGFLDTPVVSLLQQAAEALEQRLGLLRDTERRLEETVAALGEARSELANVRTLKIDMFRAVLAEELDKRVAAGSLVRGPGPRADVPDCGRATRGRTVLDSKGLRQLVAHWMNEAAGRRDTPIARPSDIHELVDDALGSENAIYLLRAIREGLPLETERGHEPTEVISTGAELRAWLAADDSDPEAVISLAPVERERPRIVECPACHSNGSIGGTDACYNCGGTGAVEAVTSGST